MSLEDFKKDLASVLNRHSMDTLASTPDFILADYLSGCLSAYCHSKEAGEKWHGRGPVIVPGPFGAHTDPRYDNAFNNREAGRHE